MECYGFVYLWRDRRTNRFYLGSHMGTEDDGYVCSSREMRAEHAARPFDFKRRIIFRLPVNDHRALLAVEGRWLRMIKAPELGRRYYNLTTIIRQLTLKGGTVSDAQRAKLSERAKGRKHTAVAIEKIIRANLGKKKVWKNREQAIRNLSLSHKGKKASLETRAKMSAASKGKNTWSKGYKHTAEARSKMSAYQKGRTITSEWREKIRRTLTGKPFSPERCANISAGHARRRQKKQGGVQLSLKFEAD